MYSDILANSSIDLQHPEIYLRSIGGRRDPRFLSVSFNLLSARQSIELLY